MLLGLSTSSIQVGHPLNFVGEKFIDVAKGRTYMQFNGVFHGTNADYDVTELDVKTSRTAANEASWPFFGHYRVPFVPTGDEIGTFKGTVTPINVLKDGTEIVGEPLSVVLTVEPSIILHRMQPTAMASGAECDKPSLRMLGGYAYEIEAATIGFAADNLSVNITGEPGGTSIGRTLKAPMVSAANGGSVAGFGKDREFTLAPVPADATTYIASIRVTAKNADNDAIQVVYPLPVIRPLAFIPNGEPRLAQIEQAVPVSGCMAGGINGQNVRYEETQSETRQRQIQYNWNSDWSTDKSTQTTETTDWSNGTNTGFSNGGDHNWGGNWSENAGVSGGTSGTIGGGLAPGSVSAHIEASYGKTWGGHDGGSQNWSDTGGTDRRDGGSTSDSSTLSTRQGGSEGVSEFYDVSSTKSITSAVTADIIPSMFGVWFRQVTRWSHPAAVVEYDLCGNPHMVAEVEIADYQWAVSLGQGTDCVDVETTLEEPVCYSGC
ncbi:MAG: hypothetical protein IPL79_08875 [Myxococcales bacterium]|nr:hypothetical protein [Myxococcales bacterium]